MSLSLIDLQAYNYLRDKYEFTLESYLGLDHTILCNLNKATLDLISQSEAKKEEQVDLNLWVAISAITGLTLTEWLNCDKDYKQQIYQAVVNYMEVQERKNKEAADKIINQIDKSNTSYQSSFTSMPNNIKFQES